MTRNLLVACWLWWSAECSWGVELKGSHQSRELIVFLLTVVAASAGWSVIHSLPLENWVRIEYVTKGSGWKWNREFGTGEKGWVHLELDWASVIALNLNAQLKNSFHVIIEDDIWSITKIMDKAWRRFTTSVLCLWWLGWISNWKVADSTSNLATLKLKMTSAVSFSKLL